MWDAFKGHHSNWEEVHHLPDRPLINALELRLENDLSFGEEENERRNGQLQVNLWSEGEYAESAHPKSVDLLP